MNVYKENVTQKTCELKALTVETRFCHSICSWFAGAKIRTFGKNKFFVFTST